MKRVIIESPYAGDVDRNVKYAREALADSLHRGESPIASHLLYTQPGVLDDTIPEERTLGMEAGFEWHSVADVVAVYADLGFSGGMREGMRVAEAAGTPIEIRRIR